MFLFLTHSYSNSFFPKLLVESHVPEFIDTQFDTFYPPYPESISQLEHDCQINGNESCLKLGIRHLYNIKNVTNPKNFEFLFPIFGKCAKNGNGHCIDFLTQLQFFHTDNFDYHIPISQNSFSKTVFGRIFRSNMHFFGKGLYKSCISAVDDISSIARAAFIESLAEPFHCMKSVDYFDSKLVTKKTIMQRVQLLEMYLLTDKFPREFPVELQCCVMFEKPRKMFLDFLNSERAKKFGIKDVYKMIIEDWPHNETFYSILAEKILQEHNPNDFSKLLLSISSLFLKINGSRRSDAVQRLCTLADNGDTPIAAYLAFSSILGIEPFDYSFYNKYLYKLENDTFSKMVFATMFQEQLDNSLSCDESYRIMLDFIHQSVIFRDSIKAFEAVDEKNFDLAILIYERLALMGSEEAANNLGVLLDIVHGNKEAYEALNEMFNFHKLSVQNGNTEKDISNGEDKNKESILSGLFKESNIEDTYSFIESVRNSNIIFKIFATPISLLLKVLLRIRIYLGSIFTTKITSVFLIVASGIMLLYLKGSCF